jgi:multicomponent Na+:H+ antiporter subunit E
MPLMRLFSLFMALYLFWLALSGHFSPFLLTVGVAAAIAGVGAARLMNVGDAEGHPIGFLVGAITYWPWLIWEIIKSAWSVTKVIVDPELPISPTMTRVRASQRTTVGMATYANSITLTPGTITTDVSGDIFTVHALVTGGADDLEAGGMDDRVSRFEGRG